MVKKGYFKNLLIIIHDDCILMKHVQMTSVQSHKVIILVAVYNIYNVCKQNAA